MPDRYGRHCDEFVSARFYESVPRSVQDSGKQDREEDKSGHTQQGAQVLEVAAPGWGTGKLWGFGALNKEIDLLKCSHVNKSDIGDSQFGYYDESQ